MFRDTFAVEHLLAATPIEDVAKFLGHSSTKITEKHYNPWVRARQERAEAHSIRCWSVDPVLRTLGGAAELGSSKKQ